LGRIKTCSTSLLSFRQNPEQSISNLQNPLKLFHLLEFPQQFNFVILFIALKAETFPQATAIKALNWATTKHTKTAAI
jgi:hypothetical protein